MSMSSDGVVEREPPVPVTVFSYRDMGAPASHHSVDANSVEERGSEQGGKAFSDRELKEMLQAARSQAAAEIEARLKLEYEMKSAQEAARIRQTIEQFQAERRDYFARVEVEVIQLVLAIAAKILHREAQVDPMLMAALVRVAIDKLHDGSSVSVRVSPAEVEKWRVFLANPVNGAAIQVIEDGHLGPADCILETELGSANFSMEAQMKEVERGFFDLLAQRPDSK